MKTLTLTNALIALILIAFFACSSESENKADARLGKLEVEIPAELEGNPEVVAYIKGMNEVVDEYALLIDDIMEDVGEYAGVKQEDLGMMDQIKLTKATAEVSIKSVEIMSKWGEHIDKRANLDQQLSDEEIKALENVYKRFEQRFVQIQQKHAESFENGNQADQE